MSAWAKLVELNRTWAREWRERARSAPMKSEYRRVCNGWARERERNLRELAGHIIGAGL